MSKWADSKYEGEYLDGWFHGKGKYYYSSGVIYEGDFYQGEFHGDGVLIYPNGGQYKAKWEKGKMQEGVYYFDDQLRYEPQEWNYCVGTDRRFHQEIKGGIKPAGITQMTRDDQPFEIPEGTYDVGEGYYEPVKSIIYRYDNSILRTPSEEEIQPKEGPGNKWRERQSDLKNDIKSIKIKMNQDYIEIQQEVFKYIAKPAQQKTKNDLMQVSQLLKKLPFEAQQFRQYCINSKVFQVGDTPKYVYIVTKGEFVIMKYCNAFLFINFFFLEKQKRSLFQKIFSSEVQQKIEKVLLNEVFGLDEVYNDQYSYEVICSSMIGEVFCIRKGVFDKLTQKKQIKKPNLQIDVYDITKPQIMEIQSAKGSTPMNRLHLGNIPRMPEEISTHRHEKKTIDFNSYRYVQPKKYQEPVKVIEELEEPPLNNRFLDGI